MRYLIIFLFISLISNANAHEKFLKCSTKKPYGTGDIAIMINTHNKEIIYEPYLGAKETIKPIPIIRIDKHSIIAMDDTGKFEFLRDTGELTYYEKNKGNPKWKIFAEYKCKLII